MWWADKQPTFIFVKGGEIIKTLLFLIFLLFCNFSEEKIFNTFSQETTKYEIETETQLENIQTEVNTQIKETQQESTSEMKSLNKLIEETQETQTEIPIQNKEIIGNITYKSQ